MLLRLNRSNIFFLCLHILKNLNSITFSSRLVSRGTKRLRAQRWPRSAQEDREGRVPKKTASVKKPLARTAARAGLNFIQPKGDIWCFKLKVGIGNERAISRFVRFMPV